jgi:ABC-type nickel/cobalt efflux system permease component RcnA/Tol biopolymer transport system component
MKLLKRLTFLTVALLGLIFTSSVRAHPADIIFHNYEIAFSADGVEVVWGILPGPLVTEVIWNAADGNGDGQISPNEARRWTIDQVREVSAYLAGTDVPLSLDRIVWPESINALRLGDQAILIYLTAGWPQELTSETEFSFENTAANSLHWFALHAEADLHFALPQQTGGLLTTSLTATDDAGEEGWLAEWESGKPAIPGLVTSFGLGELAEQASQQSNRQQGVTGILEGLILDNETSPLFFASAFSLALLLGALHALSPGHGKTVVAAYLVGASGKFYHAIVLGTIVTLTHTGSVFALGLLTLAASSYLMPTDVFPLLELVSGLLILGLGLGLLLPRLRDLYSQRQRQRKIDDLPVSGPERLVLNQPITEIGPKHSHIPESGGYIPRGPAAGSPLSAITWRSLFTLGISGGLVPCPDAIAILLIAVTINRVAFGLSLIVSFSLGLAVVLILIGLMIVEGRRLFERLRWFDRAAFIMPVISAIIVLGLGVFLSAGAVRNMPADSISALTSRFERAQVPGWEEMEIVFLDLDDNFRYQIFTASLDGGTIRQITDLAEGAVDPATSPDGKTVIYAAADLYRASGLWLWDLGSDEHRLVLACAPDYCSGPVWSPDGSTLIYERLPNPAEENALGITSLWWLDMATGETAPLFQDSALPGFNPGWSPDGEWLSYATVNPNQVRLYNLADGTGIEIPLQTNPQAVWHPDERVLLYTEYIEVGTSYLNKLYHFDLDSQETTLLTNDEDLDENLPAWSPDGSTIAVVRRSWQDESSLLGDQIWLVDADGGNPVQLTATEGLIHGQPVWSPDGQALLYHVFDLNTPSPTGRIEVLEIATGEVQVVSPSGSQPQWLP